MHISALKPDFSYNTEPHDFPYRESDWLAYLVTDK
jgi:hypothetical protein